MARIHFAIALTSVVFCALIISHYLQNLPLDVVLKNLAHRVHHDSSQEDTSSGGRSYMDSSSADYLLGVGKADITGPVVEVNLMGYADPKQLGTGVRQRLYSRAFIVGSLDDPKERVVYMVLDTQSGDTAIRHGILQGVVELGSEYKVYGAQNIAVTGTHSHSGPGAWLNYLLPQVTSKGFDKQSYEAIVTGAVRSIKLAHESLQPGTLLASSGEALDANINRSPYAYLANPTEERARYEHDVDKIMTQLQLTSASNKPLGILNWFPVHGTSMLGNNTQISGDNKGVAAHLTEQHMRSRGHVDFVAGFSQANVGDTSPNINGAYCEDTGLPCSFERSLCSNNKSEACHGRGPYFGLNDAGRRSSYEIGKRQYEAARWLADTPDQGTWIQGPIRSYHTYRDFSQQTFMLPNGSVASTCSAALGYSFAAGTTDGPGAFDFKQNSRSPDANPVWALVSKALHAPTEEQIACQAPKPILLDVGATHRPYQWTPNIVDIQMFRVGPMFIIVSPGEATTMSGRRWKEAIAREASSSGLLTGRPEEEPIVVLGGPANSYTHYIATEEEYGIQRYEGASTLYGPHTLAAYINITADLLPHLSDKAPVRQTLDPGPQPPIHVNNSLSFIQGVVFDRPGVFKHFGQVVHDTQPPTKHKYRKGDTVSATFVAANPRNNLRLEETYAVVERMGQSSSSMEEELEDFDDELKDRRDETDWIGYRTDADWYLDFHWRRTNKVAGTSEADISWEIEEFTEPGLYRLTYFGDSKAFGNGNIEGFVGHSGIFEVTS